MDFLKLEGEFIAAMENVEALATRVKSASIKKDSRGDSVYVCEATVSDLTQLTKFSEQALKIAATLKNITALQACIRAYIARKHFETEQREYQRTREETEQRARKARQEAELREQAAKEELELRKQLAKEAEMKLQELSPEKAKLRVSCQSQSSSQEAPEFSTKDTPTEQKKSCITISRQASLARSGTVSRQKSSSSASLRRSEPDTKHTRASGENTKMIQVALGRLKTKEEESEKNLNSLIEYLMKPTQGMIRSNELNLGGLAVPAIFSQFDSLHLNAKNAIKKIDDIIRDTDDKLEENTLRFAEQLSQQSDQFVEYANNISLSSQLLSKFMQDNADYNDAILESISHRKFYPEDAELSELIAFPVSVVHEILSFVQQVLAYCSDKENAEKLVSIHTTFRRISDYVKFQLQKNETRNEAFEWETRLGLPMLADGKFRDFILHGECVRLTEQTAKQSNTLNFLKLKGAKQKFPHNYTLFSDCLVIAKDTTVLANLELKTLSVRNPRLLDPSDPKNHLIITEKNAYDLEFQDKAELTEFEVKINKMIGAVERKGVFGKDLRELFIIYKGIPDEIKLLGEILCSPEKAKSEGIFRVAASSSEVKELRLLMANGGWKNFDINQKYSVDSIATLFKQFFLELPEPLFTWELYDDIAALASDKTSSQIEKDQALKKYLARAPAANRSFIAFLLNVLGTVAMYSNSNKMTPKNLAIVFSPSLFSPKIENTAKILEESAALSKLLENIVAKIAISKAAKNGIILDFTTKNSAETPTNTKTPRSPPRRAATLVSIPSSQDTTTPPSQPLQQKTTTESSAAIPPPMPSSKASTEVIPPPSRPPVPRAVPAHRPTFHNTQEKAETNIPPPQSDSAAQSPVFIPPPPMKK